ncbi:hypothetical protein GCM10010191_67370 [Actinomadura vinacea]|uniref:Uncharacterized protein n=1 Tax=Actinomadura vinacea TaxID=115336 RepID=A0ABP5X0E9_9ACTN
MLVLAERIVKIRVSSMLTELGLRDRIQEAVHADTTGLVRTGDGSCRILLQCRAGCPVRIR